jgi:hypothetical protein
VQSVAKNILSKFVSNFSSINLKTNSSLKIELSLKDRLLLLGFENQYVNSNASVEGIADNLATYHMLYGDVNLINTEIEVYRSISREEIRDVAKKYLNPNQRLILDYTPKSDKAQN